MFGRAARSVPGAQAGKPGARSLRAALLMALGGVAIAWSLRHGPTPAHAEGAGALSGAGSLALADSPADLSTLLGAAQAAIERGTIREADALLRRAIEVDPQDGRAAATLVALYNQPGVNLPVDEEAVRETIATLGPGFRVTDTKHFIVVSDCDPAWRARREALLERTYHEMMRFTAQLGLPVYPPASKLLCVMMHDHDAYQAFGRASDDVQVQWVAGYYAGGSNRMVLYDDETAPTVLVAEAKLDALEARAAEDRAGARGAAPSAAAAMIDQAERIEQFVRDERLRIERDVETRSQSKAIHEASHLIAFNCGVQSRSRRYPMWITEGLATGFETDAPDRSFGPDRPSELREGRFDLARSEGRLERLGAFVGRMRASDDPDEADAEYAQAYALFRHLARFERDGLAGLFADIAMEPPGEITPQRHVELFEARFGPIEKLERRWLRLEER